MAGVQPVHVQPSGPGRSRRQEGITTKAIVLAFAAIVCGGCAEFIEQRQAFVERRGGQRGQAAVAASPAPAPQPGPPTRPAPAAPVVRATPPPPAAPAAAAPSAPPPVPAPPPAAAAIPAPAAAPAVTDEGAGLHHLVLLSEAAPAAPPPGMIYARLEHAPARSAGQALSVLYLPSAPSGTTGRYTLLYPTTLECSGAARWVEVLDAPPVAEIEHAATGDRLRGALGLLYSIPPHTRDSQRMRAAVDYLTEALAEAQRPEPERWAAGMIAAWLAADHLYDYVAAEAVLVEAEKLAEPGSYEQMATHLARARAQIQDGRPEEARQLLAGIVAGFGGLRATEAFERARRMLAEISRRR